MQKAKKFSSKHLVFIADKDGINTVFPILVQRLKNERSYGHLLTFIYVSDNMEFIFKNELDILAKRFPTKFLVCYEKHHRQETVEAIINTNTKKMMEFHLDLAEQEMESMISELHFLGIETHDIHINTHQSYHTH